MDEYYHIYHAEADVLNGCLERPIDQKIEQQVPVSLKDRRGGHLTRVAEDFSLEGFISFKRGLTRVSGSPSKKHAGWTTLSTSTLEGLNVFEIITADRVVSQVSTDHAHGNRHVPDVTFLGTQFKNMQLNGYSVRPVLDLGICGPRPANDLPYVTDERFLNTVHGQIKNVLGTKGLPEDLKSEYLGRLSHVAALLKESAGKPCHEATSVTCSLVQRIEIEPSPIPGRDLIPGLKVIGNMLIIPEFGVVRLAEVEVGVKLVEKSEEYEFASNGSSNSGHPQFSNYFQTTMLTMNLGCVAHGTVKAATTTSNGNTRP